MMQAIGVDQSSIKIKTDMIVHSANARNTWTVQLVTMAEAVVQVHLSQMHAHKSDTVECHHVSMDDSKRDKTKNHTHTYTHKHQLKNPLNL